MSEPSTLSRVRRKTVVGVIRAWREVEGTARSVIGAEVRADVPKEDMDALEAQMRECLDSKGGELTGRAHTAELGRTYLALSAQGRGRFLRLLASRFDTDAARLERATEAYRKASTAAEKATEGKKAVALHCHCPCDRGDDKRITPRAAASRARAASR